MDNTWYYAKGDKSVGPISLSDLQAMLSRVSNASSVLVWRDGFATWTRAGSIPELASYVVKPPPLPVSSRGRLEATPPINFSPNHSGVAAAAGDGSTNLHPWRRYFARMMDLYIFMLVFFFVLGVVFPELFEATPGQPATPGNDYLYSFVGLAAYTVFEAISLNVFGITFGKLLYGIKIRMKDGDDIALFTALKRAIFVWLRGLGLGFPLVTLATLIVAYRSLREHGQTSWDRDCNCLILHRELSILRWFVIAITWALLLSTYVILIALGARSHV
jgi:hypothetical protein